MKKFAGGRLAGRAAVAVLAAGAALGTASEAGAAPYQPTGPGLPSVVSAGANGSVLLAVQGTSVGVRTMNVAVSPAVLGTKSLPGGGVYGTPSVVRDVNTGRTMVFARGSSTGAIYYQWQSSAGTWQGWRRVPNTVPSGSYPTAVIDGNRVDLFYSDPDGAIEHAVLTGLTSWSSPELLTGRTYGTVSAYKLPNGLFRLWVIGTNDRIYHATGTTGRWQGWYRTDSYGTFLALSATVGFDPARQREDVFAVGTDGRLYEGTFFDDLTRFSEWVVLDGGDHTGQAIAASAAGPGRMVVLAGDHLSLRYKQYLHGWTPFRDVP
ncbi:MAG TPA: hypothetical protein VLJ59_20755 [Mycobacteriales bacterium]|nr:hypothetical protein [Mycobacteriales bacterium]